MPSSLDRSRVGSPPRWLVDVARHILASGDADIVLRRHPKEPRMVAVTLTDVAGVRYAITLSTADVINLHEVLGILFSTDQNT